MKLGDSHDIERSLRSVTLKAAPPELREKVLRAAAKRREETAWTTPLLRRCLVACAIVLLVVFVADGLISRTQKDRFIALTGGPRPAASRSDDESALLAEALGGTVSPGIMAQEMGERRKRVIRITAKEDLLQIERLMEDGNESQKNLH